MKILDNSQEYYDAYKIHHVFEQIDHMMEFYDGISNTSFSFIPNGTLTIGNYEAKVYQSIRTTLESIKTLLKLRHITDAFVLIRKYFDTVLANIYLDVVREDKFDWMKSLVVNDLDEWLKKGHRIPRTERILKVLKYSNTTEDLYPWFGWDTYLKTNRSILDNHVHVNNYGTVLLNCPDLVIQDCEEQLENASIILNQIMMIHLAFTFYMNGPYMMSSDYMDCREMDMEPPQGSECWLAPYAQQAFDMFLKPNKKLAMFIKEHCRMDIEIEQKETIHSGLSEMS